MSVGEWLDATFTMYRRNFVLIASISAVVQIPYALLTWLLFEITGRRDIRPFAVRLAEPRRRSRRRRRSRLLNTALGVFAVSGALLLVSLLIVVPLGEAATTRAVSDRYLDRPSSLRRRIERRWAGSGR